MSTTELLDSDPSWVGGVQVVGRLGEGGMGVVYLGRQPGGQAVAVKVVRADLAVQEDYRRRFALEVSALRGLGGVHTAAVLDADVAAQPPWMVMEYVQGPTLADRVNRHGALPEGDFVSFAEGLMAAAVGIWQAGIVHRDLKPSNVVLSPDGVKLLDFGVARFRGEPPDPAKVGSVTWMSPEQLAGSRDDSACDVHACAMLLYFAATGRHVYGYGDPDAVSWRISHSPAQLVDLPSGLVWLADVLAPALDKDPSRRPSLVQLREAVIGRGAQGVAQAEPATTVGQALQPAGRAPQGHSAGQPIPHAPQPAVPGATRGTPRRRPVRRLALLGVTIVALWVAGWVVGLWPLGGPLAPAEAVSANCGSGQAPADFAAGSGYAQSGSGQVSRSLLGRFPGPFGEYRVPTAAIGCQIGQGVSLECDDQTLPEGAIIACRATDEQGTSVPVLVGRGADGWNWLL